MEIVEWNIDYTKRFDVFFGATCQNEQGHPSGCPCSFSLWGCADARFRVMRPASGARRVFSPSAAGGGYSEEKRGAAVEKIEEMRGCAR